MPVGVEAKVTAPTLTRPPLASTTTMGEDTAVSRADNGHGTGSRSASPEPPKCLRQAR